MRFQLLTLLMMITASSCATSRNADQVDTAFRGAKLTAIIQKYADAIKRVDPFEAPYFNVEEDYGKFGDYPSPEYFARYHKIVDTALSDLKDIDPKSLPAADRLTYRLFKEDMETTHDGFQFPTEMDFNQMGNRLHEYLDTSSKELTSFPFNSVKHYEDYLNRAQGLSAYVDHEIALLRQGIKKKLVLSCIVAAKTPNTYKDALEGKIEKNPFYRPILFMPKTFSAADKKRLTREFRKMVSNTILPNYRRFDQFFKNEYIKNCREGFGLSSLQNGADWYRYEIKANTNLSLLPESIHQTGLAEVARISTEIEKIKSEEGFKGSLKQFLRKKSSDKNSYFKSSKAMFDAFERVKAKTALIVPKYFSLVPKSDFKIVNTSNSEDAAGSYNQPTETAPYGRFIVNTKNLKSVAIYGVTTLMLHETVPGHHFQLALQYEMKELSDYQRKMFGSNAFVEGWALYSEYLGNEMGMYTDPDQRFGNLNDEMLRAVRLVVDTGIHAKGWSQKQAIAYAEEHLASDHKGIETEINRYSVWPGQALGYKIGQLKILELRRQAEEALGSLFDIKGFHKAVIGNGTVSLGVLETQVNDWILDQSGKPNHPTD
jgi:uncharacterized protein (DUF885 family)